MSDDPMPRKIMPGVLEPSAFEVARWTQHVRGALDLYFWNADEAALKDIRAMVGDPPDKPNAVTEALLQEAIKQRRAHEDHPKEADLLGYMAASHQMTLGNAPKTHEELVRENGEAFMSLDGLALGAGVYEEQAPEMSSADWFITASLISGALHQAMETGDDNAAFARLPLDGFDSAAFSQAAEKYRRAFQDRDAESVSAAMKARDELTRAAVAADGGGGGADGDGD